MQNLVIDCGNTLTKWAVFENDIVVNEGKLSSDSPASLVNILQTLRTPENTIISSVIENCDELTSFLKSSKHSIQFSHTTPIPVKNRYKTRQTLGLDRLAGVVGAAKQFPHENCLVVDIGTCIKFDFVTHEGEYLGGNISPGLNMRFAALNIYTDKLPLLSYQPVEDIFGKSTREAIITGVVQGMTEEIKGTIALFSAKFGKINIIITGGDASLFENRLNIPIFADPNLVLNGLNAILEYNLPK